MSSGVLMMIMKLMVMMKWFDVYQRCSQEIEKKFEGYLIGTFRKIMWGYDNLKKKKKNNGNNAKSKQNLQIRLGSWSLIHTKVVENTKTFKLR